MDNTTQSAEQNEPAVVKYDGPKYRPDPDFDMYRLEAVVTELRGHRPAELDFDRIIKCASFLNKIASSILDTRK